MVTPDAFELEVDLPSPSVVFPIQTILPVTQELALQQQTPTVIAGVIITPPTFELALTQHSPSLGLDCTVTPDTFVLALTQEAALVALTVQTMLPDTFELALALHEPTIDVSGDVTITPNTFELALELLAPSISTRLFDIPPFMEKDLIDPYSGGAWLWLVEITVPGQAVRRITRNTENVVYDGSTFEAFNLQIGGQTFSGDGSIPRVTLQVFQDADRLIEDMINATEGALGAVVKLIRVNEKFLDIPVAALEADYDNLASQSDTEWITFTLGVPNPLTQRFPLRMYSSSACPWATPMLFKGPECQYAGSDKSCTGTYKDCYAKGNAIHFGAELGLDPNVIRV